MPPPKKAKLTPLAEWDLSKVRDKYESFFTGTTLTQLLAINTHLTEEDWQGLMSSPIKFPEEKPVFHHIANTKSDAEGQWRSQVNLTGKKDLYITRFSAIFWYLENESQDYKTVGDVQAAFQHKEGSHLLTSYPYAERDFNPNNLRFDSGLTNKSRQGCTWRFYKVTGQLEKYEDFLVEVRKYKAVTRTTPRTPQTSVPPKLVMAYTKSRTAAGDMYAGINEEALSQVSLPSQPQPSQDPSQASTSVAANSQQMLEINCLHDPPCRFWRKEWPKVPEMVLLGNAVPK